MMFYTTSYYGRALAVVRAGESGQLKITASAQGGSAAATVKIC